MVEDEVGVSFGGASPAGAEGLVISVTGGSLRILPALLYAATT